MQLQLEDIGSTGKGISPRGGVKSKRQPGDVHGSGYTGSEDSRGGEGTLMDGAEPAGGGRSPRGGDGTPVDGTGLTDGGRSPRGGDGTPVDGTGLTDGRRSPRCGVKGSKMGR
jgi:hypothetical protein